MLERWQFHNAMNAIRHVTLARVANAHVSGRPMASFFGVLAGAAADECLKARLPLPWGWESTIDDEHHAGPPVGGGRAAAVAAGA
jgi:hypothetical protein